jgi:hypothetical protein
MILLSPTMRTRQCVTKFGNEPPGGESGGAWTKESIEN